MISDSSKTTGKPEHRVRGGLGWEVWLNGMEVTQFTDFQQVGGLECSGDRRDYIRSGTSATYIQGVDSLYDLGPGLYGPLGKITRDAFHQNEVEQSDLQL